MNTTLLKAVLYVRVSSQEQKEDGFSLQAQEKEAELYADKKGFQIIRKWIVSESAKTDNRKAFYEMLDFVRKSKDIKTILIEKPDRMTRNFPDLVKAYELVERYDKEIHFFKQGQIINRDSKSYEKLNLDIQVVLARQYINNLSEETKKGLNSKAEQGDFPTFAPLGYKNNKETRKIEIDLETASFIRKLFELYSMGNYSLLSARNKITEEGLRTKKGQNLHKSHIEKILKNPVYYGDFIWGDKLYKGNHEPIISRELFEQVQKQLHRHHKPHFAKHTFAYTGLLTCQNCGSSITAEIRKSKYIYYHCTFYKGKCGNGYIRQEALEEKLGELIKNIHIDEDVLKWLVETLKQSHEDEKIYHNQAIKNLTIQYQHLQQRLDKIYDDKLDGIITEDFWREKDNQFRRKQEEVRNQIERHEEANQSYIETGIKILELANSCYDLWKVQNPFEKRELLNFVLLNCNLKVENGVSSVNPTYKKPFDLLLNYGVHLNRGPMCGLVRRSILWMWHCSYCKPSV